MLLAVILYVAVSIFAAGTVFGITMADPDGSKRWHIVFGVSAITLLWPVALILLVWDWLDKEVEGW